MKISIAIATYNGARFLSEQIDSLLDQTRLPDEIVVSDDGSTDHTMAVLGAYRERYPGLFVLLSNPGRKGVAGNFENAIRGCRGDIILLCDQDDVWRPAKIARVEEVFAQRSDIMVVMNDKALADERLQESGATMLGNLRAFGSPDTAFIAGCCSAYRRTWFDVALPIPERLKYHDGWLIGLAHALGLVAIIHEDLQLYRRHGTNESDHVHNSMRALTFWARIKHELKFAHTARRELVRMGLLEQNENDRAMLDRLVARQVVLESLGISRTGRLECLRRRIDARASRLDISNKSRSARPAAVFRLWRKGGYDYFSGVRSALKDVIS